MCKLCDKYLNDTNLLPVIFEKMIKLSFHSLLRIFAKLNLILTQLVQLLHDFRHKLFCKFHTLQLTILYFPLQGTGPFSQVPSEVSILLSVNE